MGEGSSVLETKGSPLCTKTGEYTYLLSIINHALHYYTSQLKGCARDGESEEGEGEGKLCLIGERITDLDTYLGHAHHISSAHLNALRARLDRQVQLYEMELCSGGNVKFLPPGGLGDPWYRACLELVKSRFSPSNWLVGVVSLSTHASLSLSLYIHGHII